MLSPLISKVSYASINYTLLIKINDVVSQQVD